ncbi:hypothetical protein A9G31_05575 [Gilliamella sp. Gris1-4]|nr:hypothetical protein A9G31_05575 [Gilliamella apicola]
MLSHYEILYWLKFAIVKIIGITMFRKIRNHIAKNTTEKNELKQQKHKKSWNGIKNDRKQRKKTKH